MRKVIKIGFPILCVVIIIGTFYLLNRLEKKVEGSIEQSAAEGEENNIANTVENAEKNQNVVDENIVENEISYSTPIREEEEVEKERMQTEQEVFKIAEEAFGEKNTDDYYYTNEGMEGNKYIVAIRYKDTTKVRIYYIVDLESKTAEIYY